MVKQNVQPEWWSSNGGFFGSSYILGDDSIEGYIQGDNESLQERTARECDGILSLLSMKKFAKIIDVPCGYGRHSIYLAKKGYNVTGVDINREHLEVAITEAEKEGVPVDFLVGDMRNIEMSLHGRFDAVLNMFFSFGFFNDEKDNLRTIEQFYSSLRNGGKLLIHTDVSPEMILHGDYYKLHDKRRLREGGYLLINEEYNPETKRLNGTWNLVGDQGIKHTLAPYSVRIYSAKEYEEMLKGCGFTDISVYGSFNGENFTCNSKEMIIVGRK